MTKYRTGVFAVAIGTFAILTVLSETASAQQMGREPFNPANSRNPSMAAQLEMQRQLREQQSGGASLSALEQNLHHYITNYNSSSTSIGNMNSVTQNVGDGSKASIGQSTDQASNGNQGSSASTDVTQTSDVNTSEALIKALSDNSGTQGGQGQ